MAGIGVTWIPILQIIVLGLGTLASFLTAYLRHHVTIYLPYISETGAWSPESCIFTLTIICGTFLGILVTFVRYLVVADMSQEITVLMLNKRALYVGLVSWFGLAIVGAFPMTTVLTVHLIGAGIHFFLGLVYIFLQTLISHKLIPVGHKFRAIVKIRIGLCICLLIFLVLLGILFPIGQFKWKKKHGDFPPAQKVPDNIGFGLIIASSFFEWALYTAFLGYFSTFLVEFRDYKLLTSVEKSANTKITEDYVPNQNRINYVT